LNSLLFSHKNTKLGLIPSFSLPTASCNKKYVKMQGCHKYCYAKKIERLYPCALKKYQDNYKQSLKAGFVDKISHELKFLGDVIRIHVSGEFYSQEYFNKWVTIIKRFPHKTFYAYTKNLDIDHSQKPKNLILILSDDSFIWRDIHKDYDKVTTLQPVKKAIKCPSSCSDCLKCINPDKGIIHFKKH